MFSKRIGFTLISIVILLALVVLPAAARPLVPQAAEPVPFTPESLAAILGTLVSLAALWLPKFNTWFAGLESSARGLFMVVATVVIGVAIYVLACVPSLGFPFVACPAGGFWSLVAIILAAIVPNQTVYRALPIPAAVQRIKDAKIA